MGPIRRFAVTGVFVTAAAFPYAALFAESHAPSNVNGRRLAVSAARDHAAAIRETVRQWPRWKVDLQRNWVATAEPQPGWMEPDFKGRGWARVESVTAPFPTDIVDTSGRRHPFSEPERIQSLQLHVKPFWYPSEQRSGRTVYFRREFEFTEAFAPCASYLSAGDQYEFFVNGVRVASGSGDAVTSARQVYMERYLRPGKNVLALAASSSGGSPHALTWTDVHQAFPVRRDRPMAWLCSTEEKPGWEQPEFRPRGWVKAAPVDFDPHFHLQGAIDTTPIWHPARQDVEGAVYFRFSFRLEGLPNYGSVEIVADNAWELYVNGKLADIEKRLLNPTAPRKVEVGPLLRPGENVIAVKAENYGGPAALACLPKVKVTF